MAEIALLTAVLKKIVDLGGNLALEAGTRLYWLPEDIGWIGQEMRHIQAYLQDADRKQVGTQGMAIQILKIREIAYDMEDVLDTFVPHMASYSNHFRKSACIFCYCFASHNFAMEIAKIRRRVEDIDRPIRTYDITADNGGGSQSSIAWDPRRSHLYADEPDITGFDGYIRDLKSRVLGEEMKLDFISIVGMPGLGKTTLAKKVFKLTKQQFQCSALVYVSQQPNIEEIRQDIANQVGLEAEKCGKNLESNLFEHLTEKRYVIMFDDIWKTQTWDALKISIPTNSENGSRIIVTSRDSGVGRYIGGESSLHELHPLDKINSWQLFCNMITSPVENHLQNISRTIVEKCGGVPLAIVVTVGLLQQRVRRKDTWSEVLSSMDSHQDNAIMTTLALSFNDLPFELKPCFLYFGLFPEDYEVPAFQLINLWVAEKFIEVVGSQTLEEAGEAFLNKLIARNLIQVASREGDGRIRSCRIHDLLHTFCISKAKDSNFFDTCNNLTSNSMKVRRITTYGNERKSEWAYQTPSLRSFLSFGNDFISMTQLKNLCKTCIFLRVLSVIIDCRTRHVVSLPNEIGNLIHLSYLEIRVRGYNKNVRFPDTISHLKNLLTLDLQECKGIVSLPACFRKMKNLRHILLPRLPSHYRSSMKKLIPIERDLAGMDFDEVSLPNLQTLTSCHSSVLKAKGFSRLTGLRKLGIDYCTEETLAQLSHNKLAALHELDDLHLAFDPQSTMSSATEFDLSLFENLSKMHLDYNMGKLPSTNKFPPSLTQLTLVMTCLEAGSMETLGRLPKLKMLILGRDSYVESTMVCSGSDFPQLELLEFSGLYQLKELIVEEGGMPRLHKLIIRFCYRLKMLPKRLQDMIVRDESMINEVRQKVVLKIKSPSRAMKIAAGHEGVELIYLTGAEKDHMVVIGQWPDAVALVRSLRKKCSAQLLGFGRTN